MLKKCSWLLAMLVCLLALTAATPRQAWAQEDEKPAAAAKEGGEGKHSEPVAENYFMWVIKCSGVIGLVLFGLSLYFIATVIRSFLSLRKDVAVPPAILSQCEELLKQRDFKAVYELTQGDDSVFSRVLRVGIAELPNGLGDAREAMQQMGEAENGEMEKQISMLAVLGTLGPMIGLLGTLKGMIASFSVIAMSDTQLKASQVAGGISEALLLTFEGVALSVPAIYFYALFRNRVTSIGTTVMIQSDQILRHFAQAMRSGKGGDQGKQQTSQAVKAG